MKERPRENKRPMLITDVVVHVKVEKKTVCSTLCFQHVDRDIKGSLFLVLLRWVKTAEMGDGRFMVHLTENGRAP